MSPIRPIVYIDPGGTSAAIPLERFFPTDPPGIMPAWLEHNASRTGLLLDPLGASPLMALETAAAGYRLLLACNNPVTAFELRMLASAPSHDELTSAVVELASQKKGEDRLENAIRDMYQTACASCGERVQASAFLWRRGESAPHARFYRCPTCGDAGEHPITDEDVLKVQQLQRADRLHRSRALERVVGGSSEDRAAVEEALAVYPPRPLYVLFTLLNKIEGMSLTPRRRDLLHALMLPVLDAGNTIWAWPQERERPRQLSTPPLYLEKNLWMELEAAIDAWPVLPRQVEVVLWPDLPKEAGISLYAGRVRDLLREANKVKIERIITVFPRPNQAFWTLCSLWASWLWGREKAGGFSAVMDRRRFDWHWHTTALHSALAPTVSLSGENVPVFGILPEPAPGLVTAVVEAAAVSGMNLTGFATKNAVEAVEMEWKTGTTSGEFLPVNMQKIAREAIRDTLNEIGEPTEYIELHTAAMCALANGRAFPRSIQLLTHDKAAEIQAMLNNLFMDRAFLRRMSATAQDPESGLWWLVQPSESAQTPLADRLEVDILESLRKEKKIAAAELEQRIHQLFAGYLTPPDDLIRQCLESYANLDEVQSTWTLKESETSSARGQDVQEIMDLVLLIERKLGVERTADDPITWQSGHKASAPIYRLLIGTTAVVEREILARNPEGCETVFILPASRSGLLRFKVERDPFLAESIAENCHFLKFRTLRSIAQRADLSLELWKVLIESDPVSLEETTQLSMFR